MSEKEYAIAICAGTDSFEILGTWDCCRECGSKIFVSDSTRRQCKSLGHEIYPICPTCGLKRIKDNKEELKFAPLSSEQKKELEPLFGKGKKWKKRDR